jgi:hypothetical protein
MFSCEADEYIVGGAFALYSGMSCRGVWTFPLVERHEVTSGWSTAVIDDVPDLKPRQPCVAMKSVNVRAK